MEGDGTVQIRLAVDDDYNTVLYCEYQSDIVSSRVLEDDHIQFMEPITAYIAISQRWVGRLLFRRRLLKESINKIASGYM